MNTVTSQFNAGKIPDVEPVQVLIGLRNIFEINSKSVLYATGHI